MFLGALGVSSILMKIIFLIILGFAILNIIKNNNKNEEAFLWACYFVGSEVFIRMTKSTVSYEMGKYTVIVILIIGSVVRSSIQKFSVSYFIYIVLLLMGILFTDVPDGESIRKAIAFNLSGPFVLYISAFYFYRRSISRQKLLEGLYYMILPIFSMISYMYFRTPDLRSLVYTGSANFDASGGFGPNQVATIVGLGMFILTVYLFLNKKLTGFILLDALFLIYFTYRGLLTFSRGGIFTAVIAFFIFIFFMFLHNKNIIVSFFKYFAFGSIGLIAVWLYTSDITGGMLENRYTGKNSNGVKKEDITSGRIEIVLTQFESFYESPWFGIGVGNGKYKRQESDLGVTAASHNEMTRLIEEHGFLGVISLLILFLVPLENFINASSYQRAFLIAFFILWFLTINHSAMRIAFPGFIYGLCLIRITRDQKSLLKN